MHQDSTNAMAAAQQAQKRPLGGSGQVVSEHQVGDPASERSHPQRQWHANRLAIREHDIEVAQATKAGSRLHNRDTSWPVTYRARMGQDGPIQQLNTVVTLEPQALGTRTQAAA